MGAKTNSRQNAVGAVAAFYSAQWNLLDPLDTLDAQAREQKLLETVAKDREFFYGKKLLVAGCGYGWEVFLFHRWGALVTGVDLYVSATLEFLQHFGIDVENSRIFISQQNLETLDLPKNSYDFIYCNGILHHTANTEDALARLVDVLRPGGELLLGLYGSGGYLWALVHLSRKLAAVLSWIGIGPQRVGRFLKSFASFKGVWSGRFGDEPIERVVWTVENLYVPILKNFTPSQVEEMLQSEGMEKIRQYDSSQGEFVPKSRLKRHSIMKRLKYGTFELVYRCRKPLSGVVPRSSGESAA
jgi:SAM-dependent methyltransferase